MRPSGVERAHECRRVRSHDLEQRRDRVDDALHPAEGERGRAEAGNLPVVVASERPHEVDRIGGRLFAIVGLVQIVETAPEFARSSPVLRRVC